MSERHLVCLPATEPDDETYGTIPERLEAYPAVTVHPVRYPRMVWYNRAVCREAVAQIRALGVSPIILAGFSKSAFGAWNIARRIPDLVSATILFDSPVVWEDPPEDARRFFTTDALWQRDLPTRTLDDFAARVSDEHRLALISGESFHEEMCALAGAVADTGIRHAFLSRPRLKHHWDSGWLDEGLEALAATAKKTGRKRKRRSA